MDQTFKIDDNSDKVIKELDERVIKALYIMGLKADEHIVKYMSTPDAKGNDIVDTGRLRASISFITPEQESGFVNGKVAGSIKADLIRGRSNDGELIIGSNVEYAAFVNNGTSKQVARNFMEHGINNARPEIEELLAKLFKGD